MNRTDDTILTRAAEWHAAIDSDAMDWDGFTAWLESDPRHRQAYDEIALADAVLADHRDELHPAVAEPEEPTEATIPHPLRRTRMRWAGAAIAATLAALLVLPNYITPSQKTYETAGTSRRIALDDGSSVILAPRSSLTIAGGHHERMALSGGAWFDIAHDPDRSLTITAGDVRISDIGTQFDVQNAAGQVRVEVAEGKVEVASTALFQPIRLAAGKGLLFDGKAGTATVSRVPQGDAGEWRKGRLSYDAAPLPLVAADLGRYAGVSVKVPAALSNRRFSGTLVIGDGEAAVRDLSQVMQLSLHRDDGGYRLDRRSGAGQ